MYTPTPRQVCQLDEFESPRGCRKRATQAILYRYKFGERVTGQGMVPVYREDLTYRCPDHGDVPDAIEHRDLKALREQIASLVG